MVAISMPDSHESKSHDLAKMLISPIDNSCAPHLALAGQTINLAQKDSISGSLLEEEAFRFISKIKPVLTELSNHICVDFLVDFLGQSADKIVAGRAAITNEILKRIVTVGDQVDTSKAIYDKLYEHGTAFTLTIDTPPYNTRPFVSIACDEPFYLYNVCGGAFPDFIRDWVRSYLRFLAVLMKCSTLADGFLEDVIQRELMWRGVPDVFTITHDQCVAANKWLKLDEDARKNFADPDMSIFMETLKVEAEFYNELDDDEIENIVCLLVQYRELECDFIEIPDLETLIQDFENLCRMHRSECEQNKEVLDFIETQLSELAHIHLGRVCEDLEDCGDCPVYMSVLADFDNILLSCPVDIYTIGQDRYGSDEVAVLRLDLESDTALLRLNEFIIAEFFMWQLCQK